MRIERTGSIAKLTPRVIAFLLNDLGGVALDDVQSPEEERIDYECLRGLLAIELKTLEGDPGQRTDNFVDGLRGRPDFPTFYGSVSTEAAFANMADAETLRRDLNQRIGRPLVTHLKKANSQLASHDKRFPDRTRVRVMLLVNEDHPEYHPETVGWVVSQAFRQRRENGQPRFDHIDAVIYLSERHATPAADRIAFPTITILGPASVECEWKERVLDEFVERWARYNGVPLILSKNAFPEFVALEHVPDQMTRSAAWELSYRRNPYFRHLSDPQLRDEFDEVMVLVTLFGVKGSPQKLPLEQAAVVFERFAHVQSEMHERALPMEAFAHEPDRQIAAAVRLKLAEPVIAWLRKLNADLPR